MLCVNYMSKKKKVRKGSALVIIKSLVASEWGIQEAKKEKRFEKNILGSWQG